MPTFARSNRDIVELQLQWWAKQNDRPLVGTFAPYPCPNDGQGELDVGVSPDRIVARKLTYLEASAVVPSDSLRTAFVDYGTAFLPALAGAGFEYDGHTSWAHPCASSAAELRVAPFDSAHPLWRSFEASFRRLLAHWTWETYLPSTAIMVGPMDLLSALLGPQTLAMELYEDPVSVETRVQEAARLFLQVYDIQRRMIQDAGLHDGMADWMNTWLPGEGICYSEDFSALCGEGHFRRFFAPPNRHVMSRVGTAFLHLHSAAIPCLPALLEISELDALELSNDPNGPSLPKLVAAARQVQAAGIPLQVSNWEHPLTPAEIDYLLTSLRPQGLKVTLQAASLAEAQALYAAVKAQ
jgi:hypothetical protein